MIRPRSRLCEGSVVQTLEVETWASEVCRLLLISVLGSARSVVHGFALRGLELGLVVPRCRCAYVVSARCDDCEKIVFSFNIMLKIMP